MNDYLEIQQQTYPSCDNTVDFCADVFIPFPFTFTRLDLEALDVSCLNCCFETCEVTTEIPDPCSGSSLFCPLEVIAVRALGCIKVFVDVIGFNPRTLQEVAFCGNTTVCVDNVICFRCLADSNPCGTTFFNGTTISDVFVKGSVTTACGNTIVSVSGTINLPKC